jgi:hypothetical protein
MNPRALLIHVFWAALALGGCVEETPLANAGCPCSEGFTCCADANVCVATGAICPLDDWQVDDLPQLIRSWYGLGSGVCAGSVDTGNDGTIDSTWTVAPSLVGLQISYDADADGQLDTIERLDVFGDGRVARWGPLGSSVAHVWHYGMDGRLDEVRIEDPDGMLDSSASFDPREQKWSYFQDGHAEVAIDFDADGVFERRRVLFPDATGHVIVEEVFSDGGTGTGHLRPAPDEVVTRTFGPHGPILRQRSRGPEWAWTTYEYDENGRSIREQTFRGSGQLDSEVVKTRDELGRITRRQLVQYDAALAPYLPSRTYDYRYDCDADRDGEAP